jgi:hypothetical protein
MIIINIFTQAAIQSVNWLSGLKTAEFISHGSGG